MTKKHFEAIAKTLNERALVIKFSDASSTEEKWYGLWVLQHTMFDLAGNFAKFNDNFDSDKFYSACGIEEMFNETRELLGR